MSSNREPKPNPLEPWLRQRSKVSYSAIELSFRSSANHEKIQSKLMQVFDNGVRCRKRHYYWINSGECLCLRPPCRLAILAQNVLYDRYPNHEEYNEILRIVDVVRPKIFSFIKCVTIESIQSELSSIDSIGMNIFAQDRHRIKVRD